MNREHARSLHRWFFFVLFWLLLTSVGASHAQEVSPNTTVPPFALYLPAVSAIVAPDPTPTPTPTPTPACPTTSQRAYDLIPVDGPPADHPDDLHGDLNLGLRGHSMTRAALDLIQINGPTDHDAPQLPGLFSDQRTPVFTSAHRVYDWNWGCGEHGCASQNLTDVEVSLLGLGASAEETISIPSRGPEIYGGEYKAMVLYAAEERITLGYTRHDTVAPGYAVHLESLCVDPNLLALYRQANAAGRGNLPALHNGEVLGTALDSEVLVAVRDRGTFMDPRSRKDWWRGR